MEPQRYGPFPYVPINRRPKLEWPDGARVALWVIPNIEIFPLNEPVPGGTVKSHDIINWAARDYGARVGIFRMMEVMERHGVRGTVALNSEVCDDYPEIIDDAKALDWEFMGHNESNSRYLHLMEPEAERATVIRTFDRIEAADAVLLVNGQRRHLPIEHLNEVRVEGVRVRKVRSPYDSICP